MTEYTAEQIEFAAQVIRGTFNEATGRHEEIIFHAINATAIRSVVELVIIKPGTDKILLTRRDEDDPYYAGTWHLPGVIMVNPDIKKGPYPIAAHNAAIRARNELEDTKITSLVPLSPQFLNQPPRVSRRGGEAAIFYGAYLVDIEPKVGQMFDADDLPEPIHEHHPEVIAAAPLAVTLAMASLPLI